MTGSRTRRLLPRAVPLPALLLLAAMTVLGPLAASGAAAENANITGSYLLPDDSYNHRYPNDAPFVNDRMQLTDSAGTLSGELDGPGGGHLGTISGTVNGSSVAIYAYESGELEPDIFNGTVSADGNTLIGPCMNIPSDCVHSASTNGYYPWDAIRSNGLTVNYTGDTHDASPGDGTCTDSNGKCTLRAAIEEVNAEASATPVAIKFNIPGAGVPRITPGSALPAVTVPVNLDATTQPGTARERVALGSATSRLPFGGLDLEGGDSSVQGLLVDGFAGAAITVGGTSHREGGVLQQVSQSVVADNGVGIEVAAPATTIDGVGVYKNGDLAAADAFEQSLKGHTETPAQAQQRLLALGAGIVVRKGAGGQLRVINSVIGGLPAADGPGPASLNQAIGILLAPTDSALYGAVIGTPSAPNRILGNAFGIVYSAPGPKVGTSSISGNRFGDDPAGRPRMAPFANGVGVLLSGNVDHATIDHDTFRDEVIGILAAGGGVTGLQVKDNDLGPLKNLADLANQIGGGHPSLGDHNLFGLLLADVQDAAVSGNHVFGDALGILMAGRNSRFNVLTSNAIGSTGRPAGRRNETKLGDFGSAVGIAAVGGEKNIIGAQGAGNDVAASLADVLIADEHADTVQGNVIRDGLYGLVLGGVGDNTSVGGRTAGEGNTIARNWLGVVQANHELTPSEQKVESLGKAPADASDRQLAFDTPYSEAPLNLAAALSTADVTKDVVSFNPEKAAQSASVRYGHNLIGTNNSGGRFGNYVGMWLGGDVRKTLIGIGGGGPNVIGNNHQAGIVMFGHSGHWPMGVSVLGNSIYDNSSLSTPDPLIPGAAGLGIDLTTPIAAPTFASQVFGPTPNDPGDGDSGPNGLQNYPVLAEAAREPGLSYKGTLDSTPNTSFLIEVDSSPFCNPSGYGEGEHVLRSFTARTDGTGVTSFAFGEEGVHGQAFAGHLPKHDRYLTATATGPDGSTSEFSACAKIADKTPPLSLAPGDPGVTLDGVTSVEAFNASAYDVEEIDIKYESLGPPSRGGKATDARGKPRTLLLAKARVRIQKQSRKLIKLRLTRTARKLLARNHKLTVTATIAPVRPRSRTTSVRYTLYAPSKKARGRK